MKEFKEQIVQWFRQGDEHEVADLLATNHPNLPSVRSTLFYEDLLGALAALFSQIF
jgi:hypothetical protein